MKVANLISLMFLYVSAKELELLQKRYDLEEKRLKDEQPQGE